MAQPRIGGVGDEAKRANMLRQARRRRSVARPGSASTRHGVVRSVPSPNFSAEIGKCCERVRLDAAEGQADAEGAASRDRHRG